MKTLTVLLLIGGATLSAQQALRLPAAATREEALKCLQTEKMKQEWESVLNGTHKKIGFTTPEAKQMCDAMMEGSEFKEALCRLAEPAEADEHQPPALSLLTARPGATVQGATVQDVAGPGYIPPGTCQLLGNLKIQFQTEADNAGLQGALAGGGCIFGCTPCCVYAAGMGIRHMYWEFYVHWMDDLLHQAHCN